MINERVTPCALQFLDLIHHEMKPGKLADDLRLEVRAKHSAVAGHQLIELGAPIPAPQPLDASDAVK